MNTSSVLGKDWISKNYNNSETIISIIIKSKNWIVGHISYRIEKDKLHLFHLIIDENFRRLGLAEILLLNVEKDCVSKQKDYITLTLKVQYLLILVRIILIIIKI